MNNIRHFLRKQSLSVISFSRRNMSSSTSGYQYETLLVSSDHHHVVNVQLNRPERLNAMNRTFWRETRDCFRRIADDQDCRVVVVSGSGKMFSSGLDFSDMLDLTSKVIGKEDIARKAKFLQATVERYQKSFTAIEQCRKPVIAAIHGGCIGGAVSLIAACDIRYCTDDAYFSIKEVDIGIAADVGALQRLPKAVGNDSLLREKVFTGGRIDAPAALAMGLVSQTFSSQEELMKEAENLAKLIASKSPVAVQGSKMALNYSRDHTVAEGLSYMALWNQCMMQSEDVLKAGEATITRNSEPPVFSKL